MEQQLKSSLIMKFQNVQHVDGVGPFQVYSTINKTALESQREKQQCRASEIINNNNQLEQPTKKIVVNEISECRACRVC